MDHKKTLIIGAREVSLIVIALALLSLAIAVFSLGLARFRSGRAQAVDDASPSPQAAEGAQSTVTPQWVAPTVTPVIAATMAPTPNSVQHTVQPGESLISIAILYGTDLNAILQANGLLENSVIQAGQVLTVPLVPGNEGTYHE